MYVNFNFIHLRCKCGRDIILNINLKQLANQIILECKDLKENEIRYLDYSFQCDNCKKIVSKKLIVEKKESLYIVY